MFGKKKKASKTNEVNITPEESAPVTEAVPAEPAPISEAAAEEPAPTAESYEAEVTLPEDAAPVPAVLPEMSADTASASENPAYTEPVTVSSDAPASEASENVSPDAATAPVSEAISPDAATAPVSEAISPDAAVAPAPEAVPSDSATAPAPEAISPDAALSEAPEAATAGSEAAPADPDAASSSETASPKAKKNSASKKKSKKKKGSGKKKDNLYKYLFIGVAVLVIVVAAFFFARTKILDEQLKLAAQFLEEERYDEAEDAYRHALKFYPNSADAYLGLAEVSIGRGELTEAVETLDRGVEATHSSNLEKSRDVIIDQVFATYVLDSYLVNILPGEDAKLTLAHRSEDMDFGVTWRSEDENIGTVDDDGNIKAVKNGTTKIVANVGNDAWGYRDITATLIVGVLKTYLEEKGCDYVTDPSGLTAPCFVYQQSNEGYRIYDGTLDIEQGDAVYSLTKCVVSDPDPDGNVEYDIEYTITVPTKFGIHADSKEAKHAWYYNWMASEMFLCDDYTGQIFCVQDLYGEEGLKYDSTVSWNEMDYHITGSTESEWVNEEQWAITYSPLTSITWAEAPAIGTFKLELTVPKEYQGLVLALDKHGTTDYHDPEYDERGELEGDYDSEALYTDTNFFDPLEDGSVRDPHDFYVVRLADFAEHKNKAAMPKGDQ